MLTQKYMKSDSYSISEQTYIYMPQYRQSMPDNSTI